MTDDLKYSLLLSFCEGLGPITYGNLLEHFKTAKNVIEADVASLRKLKISKKIIREIKAPNKNKLDECLRWLAENKTTNFIIDRSSPFYPQKLKELNDSPIVLYGKGDKEILTTPQVSIVGSRNATPTGLNNAKIFATILGRYGITITSGLATGIDSAAHMGALDKDNLTIAVVATGMDIIYPVKNENLAHSIIDKGGVIISEYHLKTPPKPQFFPARNRIISALSQGVLVVEATKRSGSLITARLACEQGIDVFAIPGSIHNPLSQGCHELIKNGAFLVEKAEDIFDEIKDKIKTEMLIFQDDMTSPKEIEEQNHNNITYDKEYQLLLDCLEYEPQPIDIIIQRSKLAAEKVSSMMMMLQLQDKVIKHPGGLYLLNKK
jgi:DNA processing protein